MTKGELAAAIGARLGAPAAKAHLFLDAFAAVVGAELRRGGKVRLRGFGSFSTRRRRRRTVRHPGTGLRVAVPARRIVSFAPGARLGDVVARRG